MPNTLQKRLLSWFDQHGRKDLPWQKNKTPYRVWISEIMLQQTQVNTVIDYFQRFMKRFPDIATLAKATEDEVLHYWTGLGYYNRARNLHRSAKKIIASDDKKFPQTLETLQQLPGIGRSTAGAILAIAFQQRAPILDGNVKRVLARFHGITESLTDKKILDQLWAFADKHTPAKRVDDYTQAIMDLGATICVRGTPLCHQCPLSADCIALRENIAKELPRKKAKKILPVRKVSWFIVQYKKQILLEKNPDSGVWASLWRFPAVQDIASTQAIKQFCLTRFQLAIKKWQMGEMFRHTFTHFHLDILPIYIQTEKPIALTHQDTWYTLHKEKKMGLPAPVKLLIDQLRSS